MKMIQKGFFRVCFQPITTLNCCATCISWEIGSYHTQKSHHNEHTHFCRILSRNPQYDFPKMRGGSQMPFGTFPKIHPFWCPHLSLTDVVCCGYLTGDSFWCLLDCGLYFVFAAEPDWHCWPCEELSAKVDCANGESSHEVSSSVFMATFD